LKTYREVKRFCDDKIKNFPEYEERYKKEIGPFERFFKNDIDILEQLKTKKLDNRYVIPFLLGFTENVDLEKPMDMIQVKTGASGGVDIDVDFSSKGKEIAYNYLKEKFGEDRVISVGTNSRLGVSSAAKDLLRVFEAPYKDSNEFTKELDSNESWENNIERIKASRPDLYSFYEKYKNTLDLTPNFINKIRQNGRHAGGVCVLDRPVSELIPVDRVSGNLVTGLPESGAETVLDEQGIIKIDILAISILDVIGNTVNSIKEKMFLIEEEGIEKIVPESYIKLDK